MFKETKLEVPYSNKLEQLTILIGTNAAVKINAIKGIKILSKIATGRDFSIAPNLHVTVIKLTFNIKYPSYMEAKKCL